MRLSYINQLSDSHASILLKPIRNKMYQERYSYFFLIKSEVEKMQGEFFPILLYQLRKMPVLKTNKQNKTQRIEPKEREKSDSFII